MDAQEIGESVADSYSAWVQGIVQQAAADLQGQPAAQGGQGAQGGAPAAQGGQGMAPPPDQGGGTEGGMA